MNPLKMATADVVETLYEIIPDRPRLIILEDTMKAKMRARSPQILCLISNALEYIRMRGLGSVPFVFQTRRVRIQAFNIILSVYESLRLLINMRKSLS